MSEKKNGPEYFRSASLRQRAWREEALRVAKNRAETLAAHQKAWAKERAELRAENARLREALKHALSLCLQPAEDFDEADSEWCHNQRAALSEGGREEEGK